MCMYGYLEVFQSVLDFDITRVDSMKFATNLVVAGFGNSMQLISNNVRV